MRTLVAALCLALGAMAAVTTAQVRAQDAMPGFDDPLPLPPPVDDTPAPPALTDRIGDVAAPPPLKALDDVPPTVLPEIPSTTVSLPEGETVVAIAPSAPETPRQGRIQGGRVNVRAGPDTQYESITVLPSGTEVTVLAKHGDWLKILYPADQLVSIHKSSVDAQITGEIPEAGVVGTVNHDKAELRAFYWDKSTVVGTANKGEQVTIKQERGQWYRIVPPPSARAFVSAQYVRMDGSDPVVADQSAAPFNPNLDLNAGKADAGGNVKLSKEDQKALALKEAYFNRLVAQEKAREEAETQQVTALGEALSQLEARLRQIDGQAQAQSTYVMPTTAIGDTTWNAPDPMYGGYSGWLENIGRVGSAPSNFRLVKGGEIRFYLRSAKYNLAEYVGRRLWVSGSVELAAGATANVLNVDQLRVLTEFDKDPSEQSAGSFSSYPASASDPFAQHQFDSSSAYVIGRESSPQEPQVVTLPEHVGATTYVPSSPAGSPLEPLPENVGSPQPMVDFGEVDTGMGIPDF